MAKEIFIPYGVSGLSTLYASVRRPSDGQRWYTVTPTWEAYNSAHVATGYAIALTEEGTTGNYYADFPTGINTNARYEVVVRLRAGGSPAWPADTVVGTQSDFDWTGAAVVTPLLATAIVSAGAISTSSGFVTGVTTVGTVSGSVGSVTGAVGSVTGNVGGNVTGTVGMAAGISASGITAASFATDAISAAAVSAAAVTKVQAGLATSSQIPTNFTTATFASAGVFATAALANAPTGGSAPSAATVAAAVWNEPLSGHTTAGSASVLLQPATPVGSGTAQSGTTSAVTLQADQAFATAAAGYRIFITGGTGAGQSAPGGYNDSTKVFTPEAAFKTAPDNTSKYLVDYDVSELSAATVAVIQAGRATPTNITAGTMTTVTTLTNLPAVPTDWLTAAGVKADAVTKVQAGLATAAALATLQATADAYGPLVTAAKVAASPAPTTTAFKGTLPGGGALSTTTSFYVNTTTPLQACFTSGALTGLKFKITAYTSAGVFTVATMPVAPTAADTFDVI